MNPSNSTLASGALGAPVAILICWLVKAFGHVEMPVEVAAAVGALVGAVVGYFPQGGQSMHVVVSGTAGKQSGRVRISALVHLAAVGSTLALLLIGCAVTGKQMDPTSKVALQTTVRIAIRHAVQDSPRALEKASHIRSVVGKIRGVTTAESTVAGLEAVVREELKTLTLSPLDRADAEDLVSLLGVVLEARFQGPDADKLVQVNEFLDLILLALPPA